MNRRKELDILKAIGLLCIILAHTCPTSSILFQLRNFDVVLMIMVSAMLYFDRPKINNYFLKRIKRLIVPAYIFLTIFFIFCLLIKPYPFDVRTIFNTYMFLIYDGMGYVWVIRIFLLIALLLPFINKIILRFKKIHIVLFCIIIYILYEYLCCIGLFKINIFMSNIIAYIVPCVILIVSSYYLNNSDNKRITIFAFIDFLVYLLCLFLIYHYTGEFKNTNYMKYPFRLYYLSYALFICSLLIVFFKNKKYVELFYNKSIVFLSKNSLWIYLWHILLIYAFKHFITDINWIIKYILIVVFTCLIVYIQNKIVNYFRLKLKI